MEKLRASTVVAIAGYALCCTPAVSPAVAQNAAQSTQTQLVPKPTPPVYSRVKNLYRTTELVKGGQANALIVTGASNRYAAEARSIQEAFKARCGVTIPIVTDQDPRVSLPLKQNLILLGNRSTNAVISKLYDQFYTLTDLKYPGPKGYEVRTLHNPYGNGVNAVLLGGSDDVGVNSASRRFADIASQTKADQGSFSLGRLMEIKLGEGIVPPTDLKDFRIWEASAKRGGYGDVGYFGWNSISKHLAMYYMTGNEAEAREALRLSFPDAEAKKLLSELDGELIEDKNDPLAGPYHYGASMMVLFWDLVEESPVFSEAERLKVTNAFSRQLTHREGADEGGVYATAKPTQEIGDRHALFSAVSLYALGRYFAKDYPDQVWRQCLIGVANYMAPLKQDNPWVGYDNDNLFWYVTTFAPIFQYVQLTGDPEVVNPKALAAMLQKQEVILNGSREDPNIRFSTLEFWNRAAHMTGDGRWITYRNLVNVDADVFRLGQSFWPDSKLVPAESTDLYNRWTATHMAPAQLSTRRTGFSAAESFVNASYRDTTDDSGDFVLLDGMNGGKRNPYHTFAVLDLRVKGKTLLRGYQNQILTKADGMVEPKVALDGALKFADKVGQTITAQGQVPNAAFCDWRRTLVQRQGRYALMVDDVGFRTDSGHFEVQFLWQRQGVQKWTQNGSSLLLTLPEQKKPFAQIAQSDTMPGVFKWDVAELTWEGKAKQGTHKYFFSLTGPTDAEGAPTLKVTRLGENTAAVNLPQPALVVAGQYQGVSGDVVVLASDHLFGRNITRAGAEENLLTLDKPAQTDWDFSTGELTVVNDEPVNLTLVLAPGAKLKSNGKALLAGRTIALPKGRNVITGAKLAPALLAKLGQQLAGLGANPTATTGVKEVTLATDAGVPVVKPLQERFGIPIAGDVDALVLAELPGGRRYYAASGKTITAFDESGKPLTPLQTDGNIYRLHWWAKHNLLVAACADEKVIAFDQTGARKWTFVSEMDPAVLRAAKQYWFKSAAGHSGVRGLDSGVFLNGKEQLFAGSACTIEFLDENGQLVKRIPQFWGVPHLFQTVPLADGSINLLAARRITDRPSLGVINNKTIDTQDFNIGTNYRFVGVPAGYTDVPGWMDQTRFHLFHEDVDGDGTKEIIGEITGAWNRVTVWSEAGEAKYNVNFGPGENAFADNTVTYPKPNIRGIDIGNIDGATGPEIVVALNNGLVVGLDGQCRKLWSQKLSSIPTQLKIVGRNVVVGCEDGGVFALSNKGDVLQAAKLDNRITVLQPVGTQSVLAGSKGGVKAFAF